MSEIRVIKRYRNRKLYDTSESAYVTLEDVADMVREGIDVQVVENNTGEDITSVTLAQIILEEEKKKKESLPLSTLRELVQSGGGAIRSFVQKSFDTGIKEINLVKDEIQDHLQNMSDEDNLSANSNLVSNLKTFLDGTIKNTMEKVQNIPQVQKELNALNMRLKSIEKQLVEKQIKDKKTATKAAVSRQKRKGRKS